MQNLSKSILTEQKKTPYKNDQEKGIKHISVRLNPKEYAALQKLAQEEDRTISSLVRRIISKLANQIPKLENSN